MAALSAFTQRRRKQATYGKGSRNAGPWNFGSLSDDERAEPQLVVPQITKSVVATHEIQTHQAKTHSRRPMEAPAQKQDDFDVPSSDDEVGNTITRRSPPKAAIKRKLAVAAQQSEEELTPWEKRTMLQTKSAQWDSPTAPAESGAQSVAALAKATINKLSSTTGNKASSLAKDVASPGGSSAAARLKARKLQASQAAPPAMDEAHPKPAARTQKPTEHEGVDAGPIPRKRPRSGETITLGNGQDIAMPNAPAPGCESMTPAPESTPSPGKLDDAAIFDFPESSTDDLANGREKKVKRRFPQQSSRRGQLNMTSRSSPRKMELVPAILHEMLPPSDTDTTNSTDRLPSSSNSRPVTPNKGSVTGKLLTPETTVKTKDAETPEQTDVWDVVIREAVSAPSPNALPTRNLTLKSTKRVTSKPNVTRTTVTNSGSDVGPVRRRTKLVDRLRAAAPSSDNESSEDDDSSGEECTGVQMSSDNLSPGKHAKSQSQSYSQNSAAVESGPKITYAARVRSYLPEDSFEDGLMLGLPTEEPRPPPTLTGRTSNKTNVSSHKSGFDMEDSDDEDNGGRMRTIHELRAGGGNRRFEDETSSLLSDIADHNASGRSRRRSALIDLAKKLNDKAFVERFFRHGFEGQILKEPGSAQDEVADVILASILSLLLSREPPDHLASAMRDGGSLRWLVEATSNRTDLKKLAKDGGNKMSKTAQTTFTEFVDSITNDEDIWDHLKPEAFTLRTLALNALDRLVAKVRKSGDRSDVVGEEAIRDIAPSADDISRIHEPAMLVDVSLSISVLESLYANAASLAWPVEVTERLTDILAIPTAALEVSQDLHILVLRLCTYLTLDNVRNCKAFSKSAVVCNLLHAMLDSFRRHAADLSQEQREKNLAFLIAAVGVTINLTLHNERACRYAATGEAAQLLGDLVLEFQAGQKRMLEAESVEDGIANVAYGSLAVVLANLCKIGEAKQMIASHLPGHNLNTLIAAVEEFLTYHQKVDTMTGEGVEAWSVFTEMLKKVLAALNLESRVGLGHRL